MSFGDDPTADGHDADPALAYLDELGEDTMRRAWGEDKTLEYRRRIVAAAIVFGRQFERRMAERSVDVVEGEERRFLMDLMGAAVEEFAEREGLDKDEAASFLSEVSVRDHVLEFDEVLDAYAEDGSWRTLDEIFRETVDGRRDKAARSRRPG